MGMCLSSSTVNQQQCVVTKTTAAKVEDVDIVKVKLKTARDKIQNLINLKNRDIASIDLKINQKLPEYQATGNKKKLIPLLKAKKDLNYFIENAEVRQKLINSKLAEVEIQKVNVDTINILEESNQYLKVMQTDLQKRDWRQVLEDAKKKYDLEWPEDSEDVEKDPKFQALWEQLGGNKIPARRQVSANIGMNKQEIVSRSQQQIRVAMG